MFRHFKQSKMNLKLELPLRWLNTTACVQGQVTQQTLTKNIKNFTNCTESSSTVQCQKLWWQFPLHKSDTDKPTSQPPGDPYTSPSNFVGFKKKKKNFVLCLSYCTNNTWMYILYMGEQTQPSDDHHDDSLNIKQKQYESDYI